MLHNKNQLEYLKESGVSARLGLALPPLEYLPSLSGLTLSEKGEGECVSVRGTVCESVKKGEGEGQCVRGRGTVCVSVRVLKREKGSVCESDGVIKLF